MEKKNNVMRRIALNEITNRLVDCSFTFIAATTWSLIVKSHTSAEIFFGRKNIKVDLFRVHTDFAGVWERAKLGN